MNPLGKHYSFCQSSEMKIQCIILQNNFLGSKAPSHSTVVLCIIIEIGMVFVFSSYIRKFGSYFQFQVNMTSDNFTALNVPKQNCV